MLSTFCLCSRAFSRLKLNLILDIPACGRDEFTCGNGKCVPKDVLCDGLNQCGDATDEIQNCGRHTFSKYFSFHHSVIPVHKTADSVGLFRS